MAVAEEATQSYILNPASETQQTTDGHYTLMKGIYLQRVAESFDDFCKRASKKADDQHSKDNEHNGNILIQNGSITFEGCDGQIKFVKGSLHELPPPQNMRLGKSEVWKFKTSSTLEQKKINRCINAKNKKLKSIDHGDKIPNLIFVKDSGKKAKLKCRTDHNIYERRYPGFCDRFGDGVTYANKCHGYLFIYWGSARESDQHMYIVMRQRAMF